MGIASTGNCIDSVLAYLLVIAKYGISLYMAVIVVLCRSCPYIFSGSLIHCLEIVLYTLASSIVGSRGKYKPRDYLPRGTYLENSTVHFIIGISVLIV